MNNKVSFVACPNHDTNVGWNTLFFTKEGNIKCELCGEVYTYDFIFQLLAQNFNLDIRDRQKQFTQDSQLLFRMKQEVTNSVQDSEKGV